MQPKTSESGVHLWLIIMKAFEAMAGHAQASLAAAVWASQTFGCWKYCCTKGRCP